MYPDHLGLYSIIFQLRTSRGRVTIWLGPHFVAPRAGGVGEGGLKYDLSYLFIFFLIIKSPRRRMMSSSAFQRDTIYISVLWITHLFGWIRDTWLGARQPKYEFRSTFGPHWLTPNARAKAMMLIGKKRWRTLNNYKMFWWKRNLFEQNTKEILFFLQLGEPVF